MSITMHCLETAKKVTNIKNSFSPFPAIDDRSYWGGLPEKIKFAAISLGESALTREIPAIYATDYMRFLREGNRVDYETKFFERRYQLDELVVAECITDSGKYLDKIINLLFLICEESSWVLPAHNVYIRDTKQLILPDYDRPVLDLFACETGATLACALYCLENRLNAVSPLISKRIRSELRKRIITPYLTEHFWWMGNGDEPMCNWTAWCTSNVLITAFLEAPRAITSDDSQAEKNTSDSFTTYTLATPEEKRAIFEKAAASCDYFLKDYGEDGCCDEGPHYYRHAGLCLSDALCTLNALSDNAFDEIFNSAKLKNIAMYISNVHIGENQYFNFADSSPLAGRCSAREYIFGLATNQPELAIFAANDFMWNYDNNELWDDESQKLNLFYRLSTCARSKEILEYNCAFTSHVFTSQATSGIFYPSVGIWTATGKGTSLAVKSGDNNDSHNHNDTGSIILYRNNQPVLVDIGVETYTAKTFSADRYELWTLNSNYHNLPTINGIDQKAGAEYASSDVVCDENDTVRKISMDISGAYPNIEKRTYIRSVQLNKDTGSVDIIDCSQVDSVLNFITYNKPEIISTDNADLAISIGSETMKINGASLLAIDTLPITDARLKIAWDHNLYRVRLSGIGKITITI